MVKRSLLVVVLGLSALSLGCGGSDSGAGGGEGGNRGTGAAGGAGATGGTGAAAGAGAAGGAGATGGTGGSSGSGGTGLGVEETIPPDTATDIDTLTAIRVRFDAALDGRTVTTTSFTVRGANSVPVPGIITVDAMGPDAIFTPREPLALMTAYTATVTTSIESVDGHTLRADYSWSFTTRDGAWSGEVLLLPLSSNVGTPTAAVDPGGTATAVWGQGSPARIEASRRAPGSDWQGPDNVDQRSSGGASQVEVAVDPNGNVIAVWAMGGIRGDIWSSRYTTGGGWSEAELIEVDDTGSAGRPHVAVTPDGNALAVWMQSDGTRDNIWANRFTPQAGWRGAELIETDNVGDAEDPRVATDPSGNAMAVWSQSDATGQGIRANRFTPQMGWGNAEVLETGRVGPAVTPQVGMDADGHAIAVWHQSDLFFRTDIWSKRFTPGAGWGSGQRVETRDSVATNPQIAVAPDGHAVAVWEQMGTMYKDVWGNHFTPETGWGTQSLLEISNAGDASRPRVATDATGNAIAVWMQDNGSREDVWASRYVAGTEWATAVLLEQSDGFRALHPRVALGARGSAVVVWPQLVSTPPISIWANTFE